MADSYDPYNRDTGIEVYYHGSLREFIGTADNVQGAKRVARRDARETERPLRNYHWHRMIVTVLPLFPPDTIERPSKIGASK